MENLKVRCRWHRKRLWIVEGLYGKHIVIHPDGTLCIPNRTGMNRSALRAAVIEAACVPCPLVEGMHCKCGKPREANPLACTIWKVETDGQNHASNHAKLLRRREWD